MIRRIAESLRNRAHSYLERIRNDLNSDIDISSVRLEFLDEISPYGLQALAFANTGKQEELTPWDLLFAYFQASQIGALLTNRNTFDELQSAGELGLIRDLELRK